MEEIVLDTISWEAPEYIRNEKSVDWLWSVGLVALVLAGISIWFKNYLFAIFIIISAGCLMLVTIRNPRKIYFKIETEGLTIAKELYPWKKIKGFNIKKNNESAKLLLEIDRYFLPIYTIPLPLELTETVKASLLKVTKNIEIEESKSVVFMEKLGF